MNTTYTLPEAGIEIHVHPFLGNNTLQAVVDAMNATRIHAASLEALDASLFPFVVAQAQRAYPDAIIDTAGVLLPEGKLLLNGREYNTKEGFHVITVGYAVDHAHPQTEIRQVMDDALHHDALVVLDHPFVDNGITKTAGHITPEKEAELESLCKEYSGQVALEWNGYCIPWMRQVLKTALNLSGYQTNYHNVNQKVEELSKKLAQAGYNLPIVADTDLHARTQRHLLTMGTARIITYLEGETPRDMVSMLRENVFSGKYHNVKAYVNMWHLLQAFCLPVLFPKKFKKPRG